MSEDSAEPERLAWAVWTRQGRQPWTYQYGSASETDCWEFLRTFRPRVPGAHWDSLVVEGNKDPNCDEPRRRQPAARPVVVERVAGENVRDSGV